LETLRRYWKKYRPRGALFPSQRRGAALTKASITKVCADARKKAGLPKRVTPQTFRHSFATHLQLPLQEEVPLLPQRGRPPGKAFFSWRHEAPGGPSAVDAISQASVQQQDGFLSNRNRKEKISLCRKLFGLAEKPSISVTETSEAEIPETATPLRN
jgi:hypothetical protein